VKNGSRFLCFIKTKLPETGFSVVVKCVEIPTIEDTDKQKKGNVHGPKLIKNITKLTEPRDLNIVKNIAKHIKLNMLNVIRNTGVQLRVVFINNSNQ